MTLTQFADYSYDTIGESSVSQQETLNILKIIITLNSKTYLWTKVQNTILKLAPQSFLLLSQEIVVCWKIFTDSSKRTVHANTFIQKAHLNNSYLPFVPEENTTPIIHRIIFNSDFYYRDTQCLIVCVHLWKKNK